HQAAGAPAFLGEGLADGVDGVGQVVGLVHGAVGGGGQAGEEGGGARPRPGGLGEGLLEDDGVFGEGVEGGGARLVVAVGAEAVGAQGVDHDQDDGRAVCVGAALVRGQRGVLLLLAAEEGEGGGGDEAGGEAGG